MSASSSSSDDDSYSSSSHGGYDSDESSIGTILPAQLRDAPPEEVYSDEEERVARVEAVVGQAERQCVEPTHTANLIQLCGSPPHSALRAPQPPPTDEQRQ